MKRFSVPALAAVGFVLLSLAPARAQVPPLPPVPPLPLPPVPAPPPEAEPVFELVAPTAYPTCGTAILALFVARTTEPSLASPIIQGSQPLVAICGAVPQPPAVLRCSVDEQAQAYLDQVQAAALGAPTGIIFNPEGQTVEQLVVLEDKLPPPANTAGLGDLAISTLLCEPIGVPAGNPDEGSTSPPPEFGPPPAPPAPFAPIAAPPLTNVPATQPGQGGTQALPPAQSVGRPVLYGAIWVLPLALLIFATYYGGALTREIELPAPPRS
jgi:hypothetical protein